MFHKEKQLNQMFVALEDMMLAFSFQRNKMTEQERKSKEMKTQSHSHIHRRLFLMNSKKKHKIPVATI